MRCYWVGMLSQFLNIPGAESLCYSHAIYYVLSKAGVLVWYHSKWHKFNNMSWSIFKVHNQEYHSAFFPPFIPHPMLFHGFVIYVFMSPSWKWGGGYWTLSRKCYSVNISLFPWCINWINATGFKNCSVAF